jgi:NAD(P)-dependent dehydrogenase (short-subunit alcohol dehydrogenase family)
LQPVLICGYWILIFTFVPLFSDKNDIVKKTAIITGASGNLGQAVVKKFLDEDYRVTGIVHQKDPGPFTGHPGFDEAVLDLLNEEDCQKLVRVVVEKNKTIETAVLTAGGFAVGDIASADTPSLVRQYQLNFETAYNMARPVFLQMMKQNSGRIFLIGSRPGLDASHAKGAVAYALSKSLLFRLAEILNKESEKKNVVVSVIVPGTIDTPGNRKSMPEADFGTWVKASQIADVIYFYAENTARTLREPVIKIYNNA